MVFCYLIQFAYVYLLCLLFWFFASPSSHSILADTSPKRNKLKERKNKHTYVRISALTLMCWPSLPPYPHIIGWHVHHAKQLAVLRGLEVLRCKVSLQSNNNALLSPISLDWNQDWLRTLTSWPQLFLKSSQFLFIVLSIVFYHFFFYRKEFYVPLKVFQSDVLCNYKSVSDINQICS